MVLQLVFALATGICTLSAAASAEAPAEKVITCSIEDVQIEFTIPLDDLTEAQRAQISSISRIYSIQDVLVRLERHIPFFGTHRQENARHFCEAFSRHPEITESLPAEILHWAREDGPKTTKFKSIEFMVLMEKFITLFLAQLEASENTESYASAKTLRFAAICFAGLEMAVLSSSDERSHIDDIFFALSLPFLEILRTAPEGSEFSIASFNCEESKWYHFDSLRKIEQKIRHLSLLISAIEGASTGS